LEETKEKLLAVSAAKQQLEQRTQEQLKELRDKLKWAEIAVASLRVQSFAAFLASMSRM
jgi:RNA-binding protein YlmH